MTASQFRRGGAAVVTGPRATARWVVAVAQSERGVCAVLPGDNDAALLDDLRRRFPNAELREGDPDFVSRWPRFSPTSTTAGGRYRCRWICRAPRFSCRSGRRCGRSRWARPAATAGGRAYWPAAGGKSRGRRLRGNSLAMIVPCHRVVREDGALSGYRWGTARKRSCWRARPNMRSNARSV